MPRKPEGLGKTIETARTDKELSREKLAELVGVSPKHLSNIEHGISLPSVPVLAELIYTLEIPPEKVFYPNNELTNPKLANALNAVRRLNNSELSIIKDLADSLLRSRQCE